MLQSWVRLLISVEDVRNILRFWNTVSRKIHWYHRISKSFCKTWSVHFISSLKFRKRFSWVNRFWTLRQILTFCYVNQIPWMRFNTRSNSTWKCSGHWSIVNRRFWSVIFAIIIWARSNNSTEIHWWIVINQMSSKSFWTSCFQILLSLSSNFLQVSFLHIVWLIEFQLKLCFLFELR